MHNNANKYLKLKFNNINLKYSKCFYFSVFVLIIIFLILYNFTTNFHVTKKHSWTPISRQIYHRDYQNESSQLSYRSYDNVLHRHFIQPLQKFFNKFTFSTKSIKNLPKTNQLNDTQTYDLMQAESNLAIKFYDNWKESDFDKVVNRFQNLTNICEEVYMIAPTLIRHNNLYWQSVDAQFKNHKVKLYLFNAYYDRRLVGREAVKVIASTNELSLVENAKLWCLLWFHNQTMPTISPVIEVFSIWPKSWSFNFIKNTYGPILLTCEIPIPYNHNEVPQAISIQTTENCTKISENRMTNVLRVIYNREREEKFRRPSIGICVQAFRFGTYDFSVRLVEWLEMVKLMGADKVYFYVLDAHENMFKVLRHYQMEGLVDWRHLTLPGDQINVKYGYMHYFNQLGTGFWPQELLELNDCLYRNLYRHDLLTVMDIDEMILPKKVNNWHELIRVIQNGLSLKELQKKAFYSNRHAYVYEMFEETLLNSEPIPEYLYMMRHTYRGDLLPGHANIKCFHRTSHVTAVHNHFPLRCFNSKDNVNTCEGLTVKSSDSILMHYRRNREPPSKCSIRPLINCTVHDRTVWRFIDKLTRNVQQTLIKLFS